MGKYANPNKALAICDRCGDPYKRSELRYLTIAAHETRILVCYLCYDIDNPQLLLGRIKVDDPRPIWDPRVDPVKLHQRGGYGFNPVGGIGLIINCLVGQQPEPPQAPDTDITGVVLEENFGGIQLEGGGYLLFETNLKYNYQNP